MNSAHLRFGILGFGIFGEKRLIPAFKQSKYAELCAITKRDQQIATQKAEQYSIPKYYTTKQDLLNDKDINAVFIATPNAFHLQDVIDTAKAGKHILLEKPMGINANECKKMIEICEQQNVKLMIAHCMRYNSTVQYFMELINNGTLGKIQAINCKYMFIAKGYGREWIFNRSIAGGGPVIDIGIHCIDIIRYLSKAEISKIHAFNHIPANSEVELSSDIQFELSNGILSHIYCSYETPFHTELEIIGEKGSLRADNFNRIEEKVYIRSQQDYSISTIEITNGNCYALEIDDFSDAILNDKPIPIPGKEGYINQQIIDQILSYRSF